MITGAARFLVAGPIGRQWVSELLLIPLLLGVIWSLCWVAARVVKLRDDAGVLLARDAVPAYFALLLALSGHFDAVANLAFGIATYVAGLAFVAAALAASSTLVAKRGIVGLGGATALFAIAAALAWFDATQYTRLYPWIHLGAWVGLVHAGGRLGAEIRRRRDRPQHIAGARSRWRSRLAVAVGASLIAA